MIVATSDLYRPMGAVGVLDLRSMLLPGVGIMVAHDALSGKPAYLYGPVPLLDEEGDISVVPARMALAPDDMHGLADLSGDDSDVNAGHLQGLRLGSRERPPCLRGSTTLRLRWRPSRHPRLWRRLWRRA